MDRLIDNQRAEAPTASTWLREAGTLDVVGALSSALTPGWSVEREVDPCGDPSVIVLSVRDDLMRPTFVLYEEHGLVQVATVVGEVWKGRQTFTTCQRAVAAIVAAAVLITS